MKPKFDFDIIYYLKLVVSILLSLTLLLGWEFLLEDRILGPEESPPLRQRFIIVSGIFIALSVIIFSFLQRVNCRICEKIKIIVGQEPSDENSINQLKFIMEKGTPADRAEVADYIRKCYNQTLFRHYFENSQDKLPKRREENIELSLPK